VNTLVDQYGRVVRDLRISITPRCNYRCFYCDPLGEGSLEPQNTVSIKDVANVIEAASNLGLSSVRFTGGEPLLHKGLAKMISHAKHVVGIKDVAITTNASLLARRLPELLEAGLDRVNISLDAVTPEVFNTATQGGDIEQVWRGIEAVERAGLEPVKLNAVIVRDINETEITSLAELTREKPYHVRFIEYMHLNNAEPEAWQNSFISGKEARVMIEQEFGPLSPVTNDPSAPARLFCIPGWSGAIGFINPISEPFCGACSRMRLTSDGKIRPCLMTDREIDAREALNNGNPIEALQDLFLVAAHRKVASGVITPVHRPRTMIAIGG